MRPAPAIASDPLNGYIGRVFGERVMEIRFRAPSSQPLQVGEMLVVEEASEDIAYLMWDFIRGSYEKVHDTLGKPFKEEPPEQKG
jgi:hypothetical protein